MTTTNPSTTRVSPGTALTALRALATLTALNVLCQGLTAGRVLMHSHAALEWHESGAVVLHVLSGLAVLAAAAVWWTSRAGLATGVVTVLVFALSFLQGATGHGRTLYIHVPLALALLAGAMWVACWAWLRRPTAGPAGPAGPGTGQTA